MSTFPACPQTPSTRSSTFTGDTHLLPPHPCCRSLLYFYLVVAQILIITSLSVRTTSSPMMFLLLASPKHTCSHLFTPVPSAGPSQLASPRHPRHRCLLNRALTVGPSKAQPSTIASSTGPPQLAYPRHSRPHLPPQQGPHSWPIQGTAVHGCLLNRALTVGLSKAQPSTVVSSTAPFHLAYPRHSRPQLPPLHGFYSWPPQDAPVHNCLLRRALPEARDAVAKAATRGRNASVETVHALLKCGKDGLPYIQTYLFGSGFG
eukprot:26181-Chlamydomonas_euryale.AAC.7